MTRAEQYSKSLETKHYPYILSRDYSEFYEQIKLKLQGIDIPEEYDHEPTCCFCEQRFILGHTKWSKTNEHLDNNDKNHEPWNICWAHRHCNEDKRYNPDLQIIAKSILERNKKWHQDHLDFEYTREREKITPPQERRDEQTEIDLNVAHHEITENFLTEKITIKNPRLLVSDSISCIVLRCRKQTGHGSSQAVRNYLNVLACSEGDYKIEKIEGKNYLFVRVKKKLPDITKIPQEDNL